VLLALAAFTGDTARVKETKSNDAVIQQDAQAANQKVDADKESTQHQQQQKDDATAAAAGERTEKVDCTANVTLKFTMDPCSSKRPKTEWPECCTKSWAIKCRSDQYEATVTSEILNRKDGQGNFIPFEVGRMVNQGGCDSKYSLVCGNNNGYPTLLTQIAPCEEQCKGEEKQPWDSEKDSDEQREAYRLLLNHGTACVSTPEKPYGDKDFQKCPQDKCSEPKKEEFKFGAGWGILKNSKYAKIDMQKDEGFFEINNAVDRWAFQWAHLVTVKFTAE